MFCVYEKFMFGNRLSLQVVLGVSAYVVPVLCSWKMCGQDSISLTLYIHGGMWFVLFLLDRSLALKHKESRLNGYLDFYRRTRNIRAVPFHINSCGNSSFLFFFFFFFLSEHVKMVVDELI